MKDKLLLIDGHSILSRAFYGIPELSNSKGMHTNAIYGFLNILLKEIETEEADHLAVAFDLPVPTFRHRMYPEYKGTRKPMPEELREQVPLMKEVLTAMNIPILSLEGFEADDILGTIAKRCQGEGKEVTIISGDRDLLQLADEHIKISIPKTSKGQTEIYNYYPDDVKAEWKVSPTEFIDWKALAGDNSDNIPGVPGFGDKTASWIIENYHSIENAKEHALDPEFKVPRKPKAGQQLLDNWEYAALSKSLATININVPVEFDYESSEIEGMFNVKSRDILASLELKSLLRRFEAEQEDSEPKKSGIDIQHFKDVRDPYIAKIVFKDAEKAEAVGFCLVEENDQENPFIEKEPVLYFSLADDRNYRFHGFDFKDALINLSQNTNLYTLHLKTALHILELPREGKLQDLAICAYLINPMKDSYSYEDLARDFLDENLPGEKEIEDKEDIAKYTALVSLKSHAAVFKKLKELEELTLYEDIERPLLFTLYDMEKEGVKIDKEELIRYGDELSRGIEKLRAQIYEECGEEFNINSTQQLGRILFEKMGLPGGRKTKTGYSTAADVLEKLSEEYKVVDDILQYRTYAKLNSTYAQGLLNYIAEDGRIHGTFNQTVTATGRISSTEPNLQNIPIRTEMGRRFRKVFVPKSGCIFIDADYSQVELRILASFSGDEKLITAYRNADDIHAVTASQVFHVPLSEVTDQLRRNAKAVNFGIVYGISAFGLSEGLSISRKEAKEYIERYFETYPSVKEYLDGEVAFAKEKGYVKTLFGRRRPVPDIHSSNFMRRSFGERVAMNSPIQGTAADIMKKAMNEVNEALRKEGFRSRIVLQVHDELLIEAPLEEADAVEKLLVEKMQNTVELKVQLLASAVRGNNWEEAH